jgi:hypothetical protein
MRCIVRLLLGFFCTVVAAASQSTRDERMRQALAGLNLTGLPERSTVNSIMLLETPSFRVRLW